MKSKYFDYYSSLNKYYGKTIKDICIFEHDDGSSIDIEFTDGICMRIYDADNLEQYSESRDFTCDDDLSSLKGHILQRLELVKISSEDADEQGYIHEEAFLKISTNKDSATITAHNVHNGYYEGFDIAINEPFREREESNPKTETATALKLPRYMVISSTITKTRQVIYDNKSSRKLFEVEDGKSVEDIVAIMNKYEDDK